MSEKNDPFDVISARLNILKERLRSSVLPVEKPLGREAKSSYKLPLIKPSLDDYDLDD